MNMLWRARRAIYYLKLTSIWVPYLEVLWNAKFMNTEPRQGVTVQEAVFPAFYTSPILPLPLLLTLLSTCLQLMGHERSNSNKAVQDLPGEENTVADGN